MNKRVYLALCTAASAATFLSAPTTAFAALPTLHYGDTGSYVTTLQKDLGTVGYSAGSADGQFGVQTLAAVKSFQKAQQLSVDGVVGTQTWSKLGVKDSVSPTTSGPTQRNLTKKQVYFNGQLVSSPMAFDWNGTTYMPIFYVQQALKSVGINYTWDGTHWNILVPSGITPNLSNISVGSGALEIQIGGTPVQRIDGITYKDPATNYQTQTTYMPIWYVMNALKRVNIEQPLAWDGTKWYMTDSSYTVYGRDGSKLGSFKTEQDAQNTASQTPGATVKDATGKVVYKAPDFIAYSAPGTRLNDYLSQQDAVTAVAGNQNGFVVNAADNSVVQPPQNFYYKDASGNWLNSLSGSTGNLAPSFAQQGAKYMPVSGSTSQYYLIVTADGHYSGQIMSASAENPFQTVDLRSDAPSTVTAAQIDQWFQQKSCPFQGLGSAFIYAQNTYGVNAVYLIAHGIEETGWGKQSPYILDQKNNLFGYGAYDSDAVNYAGIFPSQEYSIRFQAFEVRHQYLDSTGTYYVSPTLDGMNRHYATDPGWSANIAGLMSQYVANTGGSASAYPQFKAGAAALVPSASDEPVYLMNGATASVLNNPYQSLPVFTDPGTGAAQMFPGTLKQSNTYSGAVKSMQRVIGVTADGYFGPMTASALSSWQQAHGLPATGVCDMATWSKMFPSSSTGLPQGTTVTVDRLAQGLVGGSVTLWYHVSGGGLSGWVDSEYIKFSNVYRVKPNSGYSVNVYGSENRTSTPALVLHVGDWVVSNQSTADSNGYIAVQVVNQQTGQVINGYTDGSASQLTAAPQPSPYTGG